MEAESKSEVKEANQCEVKEAQCEAQEATKEEDHEEEVSKLKTRKEVKRVLRVDLGWLFKFQNWGPGRKFLEYGENKENHISTIDNTNGFKKKRSQFCML